RRTPHNLYCHGFLPRTFYARPGSSTSSFQTVCPFYTSHPRTVFRFRTIRGKYCPDDPGKNTPPALTVRSDNTAVLFRAKALYSNGVLPEARLPGHNTSNDHVPESFLPADPYNNNLSTVASFYCNPSRGLQPWKGFLSRLHSPVPG